MKKITFLLLILLSYTMVFAQGDTSVEMDDALRANGKIYVVIGIICIIFAGLAIYLFSIDRRLKKVEKDNTDKLI